LTTLRQVSPEAEKMAFYIHDGFDLQRFSDYVSARSDFVVQDHHSCKHAHPTQLFTFPENSPARVPDFVFTPQDDSESADDHTQDITGSIAQSLAAASQNQRNNLVVDEWSCALTPDSLSKEKDPESARKRFCEGQMQVYQNTTAGWGFWSTSS
jgi:glucan 1,3-beta-glucosidase